MFSPDAPMRAALKVSWMATRVEASDTAVVKSSASDPKMPHSRAIQIVIRRVLAVPAPLIGHRLRGSCGKLRCAAAALGASMLAAFTLIAASESVAAQHREPAPAAVTPAARLIAQVRQGGADVPRIELAARIKAAGLDASDEYAAMRADAARELAGRPDNVGAVTAAELAAADRAIARTLERRDAAPATFCELTHAPGRPQVPGLRIVYLHPLGEPAAANHWRNIIAHQTEGAPGSAKSLALGQSANPTKRGVMIWVETDGTVYWATAENAIPTHGDGANRNDNKYIDNGPTFHAVVKTNTVGVEFNGNFPDVARPPTPAQVQAWLILVRFLQERYGISADHLYAHNWIDFKDARYCEGCELATMARKQAYVPGTCAAAGASGAPTGAKK
jgi:N-acetylmuramoyl-L-alanine amidase-like protein